MSIADTYLSSVVFAGIVKHRYMSPLAGGVYVSAFDATNAVLTIHTYESFTDNAGLIIVPIDLDSDGVADKLLVTSEVSSALQSVLFDDTPRGHVVSNVHAGDTMTVTIPRSLLADASSMDFNV
ncbi:MAG: hypothetical protein ACXV7D_15240, partial [Thermoanaerobaculia bacterium]